MTVWEMAHYYKADFLEYLAAAAGVVVMGIVRWPGYAIFARWLGVGLLCAKYIGPIFTSLLVKALGIGSMELDPNDSIRFGAFGAGLLGFTVVETAIAYVTLKRDDLTKKLRRDDD